VLTRVSNFWFDKLRHVIPNHLTGIAPESVVNGEQEQAQVKGRAFVTMKLKPLPIEAIVRGYLAGSGWKDYQKTGWQYAGLNCLTGCARRKSCAAFVYAVHQGGGSAIHDENITFAQTIEIARRSACQRSARRDTRAVYRSGKLCGGQRHHHRRHQIRIRRWMKRASCI